MKSLKFLALAVAFGFMLSASAEEHLKSLNPAYFDKSTPPARISTSMSTRVGRRAIRSHPNMHVTVTSTSSATQARLA